MKHLYRCDIHIDDGRCIDLGKARLPDVLRIVRRYMRIDHGNKIRTLLIEQGCYEHKGLCTNPVDKRMPESLIKEGCYKPKTDCDVYCTCRIFVERFEEV